MSRRNARETEPEGQGESAELDISLADELRKTFDALDDDNQSEGDGVREQTNPEIEEEVDEVAAGQGVVGDEENQGESEGEETEGEDEQKDSLEPPQHWASEDRETFTNIPREAQEFLLKRHKGMEADYTRKTQEISDIRRTYDAIERELQPISQELALAGADNLTFIRQQVAWASAFKQDPNAAIAKLASVYGIDLSQQQQAEEEDLDPQVAQLRQEVTGLKQSQAQQLEAQRQTEQEQVNSMIENFASAKDQDGNLEHPHFDGVMDVMVKLIGAGMAKGLDDAYPMAVNMKGLQGQTSQTTEGPKSNGKASRVEKVRKAKKAAAGVRSSGVPAKERGGDLSLHEEMSSIWDNLSEG